MDQEEAPSTPVDASYYEQTHVHAVYDAIADHFSATRYAPWPLVAQFLAAQPLGAIGLDVGCGNGKYLSGASGAPLPPSSTEFPQLFVLGSDRSEALARLAYAKHAHHQVGADVLLADSLALPFRDQCADFVICIAVVHHLSTRARRQAAVEELLRCVRRPEANRQDKSEGEKEEAPPPASSAAQTPLLTGRVLLYVWALEQSSSRRGWAAGGEQDLLVPWVKTMKDKSKKADQDKDQDKVKDKKKHKNKNKTQDTAEEPPEKTQAEQPQPQPQPYVPPVFHRYYHLYKQGELEDDVAAVGGRVVASGYEKDNWWVVADPL
ncbi:MAG: tRNA methyltransferase, has a role in tRNA modification [Sporothrix thermara]